MNYVFFTGIDTAPNENFTRFSFSIIKTPNKIRYIRACHNIHFMYQINF